MWWECNFRRLNFQLIPIDGSFELDVWKQHLKTLLEKRSICVIELLIQNCIAYVTTSPSPLFRDAMALFVLFIGYNFLFSFFHLFCGFPVPASSTLVLPCPNQTVVKPSAMQKNKSCI